MPRYFLEFVNLQKFESSTDRPNSIIVTIKLYSNSLPNITSNIASLFFSECKDDITYRKSHVTRVVSPEYIIQFGNPVRRKSDGVKLDLSADTIDEKFKKQINGRQGLVCLAKKQTDATDSIELCICFVPWGKYIELDEYVVIGECKEWKELRDWSASIDVKQAADDPESYEIPTGNGVWINRCGRLLESETSSKHTDKKKTTTTTTITTTAPGKIRAVDLMFKRQRTK